MSKKGRTGIVIQARTGSSRLPGKVLKEIGSGKTLLEWVVERSRLAHKADIVIVATTKQPQDNAIVNLCQRRGYDFFRGSEEDVLERYVDCAEKFGLDTIVRVTSDSPFISWEIIDECIELFQKGKIDYASNSYPVKTFPIGLYVETFSTAALKQALKKATQKYEHEHVTIYIYEHPDDFRIETLKAAPEYDAADLRLTLDTPEDYQLACAVASEFKKDGIKTEAKRIIAFLKTHPDIAALNRHITQKPVRS